MIYEIFKKILKNSNQKIIFEDEKIIYKEHLERIENKKLFKIEKI